MKMKTMFFIFIFKQLFIIFCMTLDCIAKNTQKVDKSDLHGIHSLGFSKLSYNHIKRILPVLWNHKHK